MLYLCRGSSCISGEPVHLSPAFGRCQPLSRDLLAVRRKSDHKIRKKRGKLCAIYTPRTGTEESVWAGGSGQGCAVMSEVGGADL